MILVIDNYDSFTWNLVQYLGELGVEPVVKRNDEATLDELPSVFDAMLAESTREWSRSLASARPRIAAIYEDSFNYLSKMCLLRMRDAALDMIDRAREAGVPVIVSGSDATDHPV